MRFRYLALMAALLASPAVFAQALVDQAIAHLKNNARVHGVEGVDFSHVVATDAYTSRGTQMTHVYLRQQWAGIDVIEANYSVSLYPGGGLIHAAGAFVPGLSLLDLPTAPALSAPSAAEALAQHVGLQPTEAIGIIHQESKPDQATTMTDGGIAFDPISARLVYQRNEDDALRLAWEIGIYQRDAQHSWVGYVDAATGAVLALKDYVDHDTWGNPSETADVANYVPVSVAQTTAAFAPIASVPESYRVYPMPIESPSHTAPAPPADGRTLELNPFNLTASPFGWHDTNGVAGAEFTTTQGNNVHAYTDVDNNNAPDAGSSPDGGAGLVFDFPMDLTQAPSAYRPAAVTNLFYWNNLIHDLWFLYGFDQAAGNFQATNYGGGGVAGDYVRAEAQDGGGTNNANMCTPPEGGSTGCGSVPRMQMYIWTAPNPDRDGDLDNGIIAHEYAHGISTRLIGGPATNCLSNSERPSEGISDFVSLLMTMEVGDTGPDRRGIGTYALNQTPTGTGIRPAPYSTDFAINNYTYQRTRTLAVPHGVGFVWATIWWEATWELIDDFGFEPNFYNTGSTAGNIVMNQLFIDSMKLAPCSPGFVDMRDAILAADAARYGNAHRVQLWTAFARRGLGFSASQGSTSTNSDNTEAFDLPPDIPVELVGFDAVQDGSDVILRWNTASETNNAGFEVQRRAGDEAFEALAFVDGHGTTTEAQTYGYRATGLASGTYTFRLKQIDFDGAFEYSNEVEVTVGVVGTHLLSEVYPNPFNPQATFSLAVGRTQQVTIGVYDVMGRRVATLHEGALQGEQAHLFTVDGSRLASGAYFVRIAGETFADTRRITLLK